MLCLGVLMVLLVPINAIPVFNCEVLDLSHELSQDIPIPPVLEPLELKTVHEGTYREAPYAEWKRLCAYEHVSTHMDVPRHFSKRGADPNQIPLNQVIGEACVFDISDKASKNSLASLSVSDVKTWEAQHGMIPPKAIVLLHTGWSEKYWATPEQYLGYEQPRTANSAMHYPSFSGEVAQWLVKERNIAAVGVDSLSLDVANTTNFMVHQTLLPRGIVGVENMANLGKLPPRGATVFLPPIRLVNGTAGFVRAFAIGWKGSRDPCNYNSNRAVHFKLGFLMPLLMLFWLCQNFF